MTKSTIQSKSIPVQITTPDKISTRLGDLEFFDGMPSNETVDLLYDNLAFLRGVECFLNFVPAASMEAMCDGFRQFGLNECSDVIIFEELLDSEPLFLTGNTDTVYCGAVFNLEKDGPVVVEVPPGCGPGTVNDAFFRFVVDMGIPGPDHGEGGKYLLLPPGYDKKIPSGYFVAKSPSYINWLLLRGFLVDGKTDTAVKSFKEGLKIYPLSKKEAPPKMRFLNGSKMELNTIHANDFSFYEEIDRVIQREHRDFLDPELRGLAASIGIQKGIKFSPDQKMKDTLTEAAAVANGTARAISFRNREKETYFYENSYWCSGFIGGSHEWLKDGGDGGRNLDARTRFFYVATVNTPAMVMKMVGKGSQYALSAQDRNGDYLDGSKSYKVNIPANVPAKDFWSLVIYDPQSRSELRTNQEFPSKNSKRDDFITNDDGSVDIYFGPTAPAGKESNWIETVAGKAWFVLLRLYGPLEPWFDKTWRPGEIELV